MFDKYQIIRVLGKGASATIYLVEHVKLQIYRAVKCVLKNYLLYEQIKNEAHIMKYLRHPNIPIIYDIEEDEQYLYIIEEYIEGESIKDITISHNHIEEAVIVDYGIQLCSLIQYLHSAYQPILYLDLKPENLLVSKGIIKLIDFGSAVYCAEVNERKYSIGTRGYAAPEQYNSKCLDVRADIYGIGMLLFYLVTGIETVEISKIQKKLQCSLLLQQLIIKCLSHLPEERYHSVDEILIILEYIKKEKKSFHSIKLAVVGTQAHIGATHFALMLTHFFNERGISSVYIEKNKNCSIETFIRKNSLEQVKKMIFQYKSNFLIPFLEFENLSDTLSFDIQVIDYGVLSKELELELEKADIKVIVMGGKEWEIENSEKALQKYKLEQNVYFCFNFIGDALWKKYKKLFHNQVVFCLPYIIDPILAVQNIDFKNIVLTILENPILFLCNNKKQKGIRKYFTLLTKNKYVKQQGI